MHIGSVTDMAIARNWDGGSAKALANVAVIGVRSVDIAGNIVVAANADDFSGAAASANAGLALKAGGPNFGSGAVTVTGDISVIAHATNDADGEARSQAAVGIIGAAAE